MMDAIWLGGAGRAAVLRNGLGPVALVGGPVFMVSWQGRSVDHAIGWF
ncbi:hypothetical protein ACFH04_29035 [Streptomyces noboritoensis]|uniref:Uncharacterized protein n=1 Tax=Streptomyces noboritoensis TaxID=67337 RepID=A0ABV6TTA5_9ACTN